MGHSGACTAWARAGQTQEGPGGGQQLQAILCPTRPLSHQAVTTPSKELSPNPVQVYNDAKKSLYVCRWPQCPV